MAGQQRVYKQRIGSTKSMQQIFRAMELIATSRIVKARQAVAASTPYARAITRAVSAVATYSDADHPLTTERPEIRRTAVLVVTSDRGMAGAYSASVLREAERQVARLREEGSEPVLYVVGRKGVAYYRFRRRDMAQTWSGFSEAPSFDDAREISEELVAQFVQTSAPEEGEPGVDEILVVSTAFVSMVTQTPRVARLLPLEVVDGVEAPDESELLPLYEFEPSPEDVLDDLLPRYITSRIHNALLQAAASEHASRQRAMKTAGDNAEDLVKTYTRLANQARQAEITQEITEIVGGADALAASSRG
ncbi:F0F1 ATP synthase subunit gamma [Pseudokineococcus sp. 1T1Z-3]|uniref:F0F1 ATP synthase subunit gamma n=1 Tax=Pseudokineococcus sp. 1T1Z-3 TaxID=3132745 RepID=UPI0030B46372